MRPWEVEGFTFSIGWPVGFVSKMQSGREVEMSRLAVRSRNKRLAAGHTGTLNGMGKNAPLQGAEYIARERRLGR